MMGMGMRVVRSVFERRRVLGVGLAAVLALSACRGLPLGTFNGGEPVALPALGWFSQGEVLRGADGGVYVVTFGEESRVTKLAGDGTVDTTWGTGGSTVLPFASVGAAQGGAVTD